MTEADSAQFAAWFEQLSTTPGVAGTSIRPDTPLGLTVLTVTPAGTSQGPDTSELAQLRGTQPTFDAEVGGIAAELIDIKAGPSERLPFAALLAVAVGLQPSGRIITSAGSSSSSSSPASPLGKSSPSNSSASDRRPRRRHHRPHPPRARHDEAPRRTQLVGPLHHGVASTSDSGSTMHPRTTPHTDEPSIDLSQATEDTGAL